MQIPTNILNYTHLEQSSQALSVLPVLEGGELVGVLWLHDLVQAGFTSNQAGSAAAAPNP